MAGSGASVAERRAALRRVLDELGSVPPPGDDPLGDAYEMLFSGAERRAAGQFATPPYAARLMAAWLLQRPVRLLLDPGVGSGRLLCAAAAHPRPPRGLLGLDADPLVAALAERQLAWRGLRGRSEVRAADFLVDALAEAPDAAIVNPPYSRHHTIAPEVKRAVHDGLRARLGLRLSGLSAMHALFAMRTIEVCAPGARIAFIAPGDWLDAAYGRAVKAALLERAHVAGVVLFPERSRPFGASVMSSAAITFFGKDRSPRRSSTPIVSLPDGPPPPVADVLAALDGAATAASGLVVGERALSPDVKWSRPARPARFGIPLGALARVRRGIATGANAFFVLTERGRRECGLDPGDLRRCVRGPRTIAGLELDGDDELDWVLACWRPEAEHEPSPLGAYLRRGRAAGIPDGYLASRRRPWFGLDRREPAAILWPYFSRGRLRFVRNRAGALALNTWLGVEPHEGVDAERLWRRLNEPACLRAILAARRSYAGMHKLEPAELGAVRVRWEG